MSITTPGRYRLEAVVSLSDAAANLRAATIVDRIGREFLSSQDNSGGMLSLDAAGNPNVRIVQERTGRVTVTVAMVFDVSPRSPWDASRMATGLATAFVAAQAVTGTEWAQLQSVFRTSRPASTATTAGSPTVTTGRMSTTRMGSYPERSSAAALFGPLMPATAVVRGTRSTSSTTVAPGGAAGSGGKTAGAAGLGDSEGDGGGKSATGTTSYSPAELAQQYIAKGAALFGAGPAATASSGPVAPAALSLAERAGLGAVTSATDPGVAGKSQGVVSVDTVADATRTDTGRVVLGVLAVAAVVGVVVVVRRKAKG